MNTDKYSNKELEAYWKEYDNRFKVAQQGDKRRYNTKMEIIYTGAMRTLFATELRKRAYCLSDMELLTD